MWPVEKEGEGETERERQRETESERDKEILRMRASERACLRPGALKAFLPDLPPSLVEERLSSHPRHSQGRAPTESLLQTLQVRLQREQVG